MTQIPNPESITVQEILNHIQPAYPGAVVKKPWGSPELISIPIDNYRLFVRPGRKRDRLILDFQPPVVWSLIGMSGTAFVFGLVLSGISRPPLYALIWLPLLLGVFATKAIFKNRIRERLTLFRQDVERALLPGADSIF